MESPEATLRQLNPQARSWLPHRRPRPPRGAGRRLSCGAQGWLWGLLGSGREAEEGAAGTPAGPGLSSGHSCSSPPWIPPWLCGQPSSSPAVHPGPSVSAKHISGGMAGLGGDLCVPNDLAKTQLQNQCGQETDKGMHVGATMCIGVWGPRRLGQGWAAACSPWTR